MEKIGLHLQQNRRKLQQKRKKNTKEIARKRRKNERKRQLKIIELRAKFSDFNLEKTEEGEKFFLYWKNQKMGLYTRTGLPR